MVGSWSSVLVQYILSYSNSGSTYIDYNGLCGVSFVVITQCLTTAVYANKACMGFFYICFCYFWVFVLYSWLAF